MEKKTQHNFGAPCVQNGPKGSKVTVQNNSALVSLRNAVYRLLLQTGKHNNIRWVTFSIVGHLAFNDTDLRQYTKNQTDWTVTSCTGPIEQTRRSHLTCR